MTGETQIRVRYAETDRMGLLHHANYLVYFEQGRTELLRQQGLAYKDLEDQGYLLVLTKVQVRYRRPARYDDVLTLRTIVERTSMVKIEHRYEMLRDGDNRYNTYRHPGLPPGPISNPGKAALLAVLKPSETDYLFFFADGKGRHTFTRTFDEHRESIRQRRQD